MGLVMTGQTTGDIGRPSSCVNMLHNYCHIIQLLLSLAVYDLHD